MHVSLRQQTPGGTPQYICGAGISELACICATVPHLIGPGNIRCRCPECSHGDLDLDHRGDGRWKIEWYAVPCPVGDTKIRYDIVVSSQYWFSLVISNTRSA